MWTNDLPLLFDIIPRRRPIERLRSKVKILLSIGLSALAAALPGSHARAADPVSTSAENSSSTSGRDFRLRGYGGVRHDIEQRGAGENEVTVHHFVLDDPQRAGWFTSKIFSDFTLTVGNKLTKLQTPAGPVDAIDLGGHGIIAPLIARGAREVDVAVGGNREAVTARIASLAKAATLREAEFSHPLYMDKWDRYCLGFWEKLSDHLSDSLRKTPDDYYKWIGEIGINPQIFTNSTVDDFTTNDAPIAWLRRYFGKYGVKYQRVEWLSNTLDIYNRNPFLTKTANPHAATRWIYYGELHDGPGPLHDVQNANFLTELRRLSGDPNQMAILDPDGEIGPFPMSYWGASGPVCQREFIRFLREVRQLSLDDVSRRYHGKPGRYKSWEDVDFPDWRTFYGWRPESIDLAGEWRFMRDDKREGYSNGWAQPSFDDSDWARLYYPGDALVYGMDAADKPLWMRKTVTIPRNKFHDRIYLSVAPLSQATVQVFINGQVRVALDPRFDAHYNYGQFDITDAVANNPALTIALRFAGGDAPNGPIFLTSKEIEDFPTSDPLLNARRWDIMEFVDWSAAQGVVSTLSAVRSVEPERPIKVHAYGMSPWGWKTLAKYGGFSHHTGSGPGWSYTEPHQLALARDLQDSSETGSSTENFRETRGLFGNLIYMGKNAFDYFHDLMSITKDPESRAWFEKKIPAIKLMGRAYALASPVAEMKGYLSWHYLGETAHSEAWRFDVDPTRGGEMTPFLDEIRIEEGGLNRYAAIIDPGTQCWDDRVATALRSYVEAGGVLVLNSVSGQDTFLAQGRGSGPGASLAGVRLGPPPANDAIIHFSPGASSFAKLSGNVSPRFGVPSHSLAPQAGVDVIGAWGDGSPAFTRRALGKGAIYFCGGSTYPSQVITALAAEYGPRIFAVADKGGGVDLLRTLRSNNGCEDLLMLRGLGNKPAVIHWTFDYPPQGIYDPVTGASIPASIDGDTATFTVNIPDWDFSWFAARRPGVSDAFSHWFTRQTQMWSGREEGVSPPEVPIFRHIDLNHGWKIAQTEDLEKAKALMALDDKSAGLIPTELIPWNSPGMNLKTGPGIAALYRNDFELPAQWEKDSLLALELRGQMLFGNFYPGWNGKSAIYLNGSQIWEGEKMDQARLDATALFKPGRNRLEIVHQGDGIMASIMLERSAIPDSVIDLAGEWRAVDGPQSERKSTLPGAVKTGFVYRDVDVPSSARGQDVWLRAEGSCSFAIVNGRVRYWDLEKPRLHAESPICEIDISPDIRPGQVNRIVLGTEEIFRGWHAQDLRYNHIELALYRPGKWSLDGKSNRDALTPGELERVAQDLSAVQFYPLIHPPAPKTAPPSPAASETPAVLPQPSLNLNLHPSGAVAVDEGPSHLPVSVSGAVEPFGETGGGVAGAYFRGASSVPGGLSLQSPLLSKLLEGKGFTVRVWIMPMAGPGRAGVILGSAPLKWSITDDSSTVWMGYPYSRKLNATTVLTPRAWQSLVLAADRPRATLYVNGVAVAEQTWVAPVEGGNPMVTIGNASMKSDFLDAKIAAFTIYEGALSARQIAAQYLSERSQFAPESVPGRK